MTRAAIILCAILLAGCGAEATTAARGEARLKVFEQCMTLAAKMPRQADDDVSDIVQECGQQSYYRNSPVNTVIDSQARASQMSMT